MKFVTFFDPKTEINFPRYFRGSLWLALIIPLICVVGMLTLGINWGIDFKGGTEMQVLFSKDVQSEEIRNVLEHLGFSKHQVQSYGPVENKEMLIRVERITPFADTDITKMRDLVSEHFGFPAGSVTAFSNADLGDRVIIKVPTPQVTGSEDPSELSKAIADQKMRLAQVIEEKSGFHLLRTKAIGAEQGSINDAIVHDAPVEGSVAYTLHFLGAAEKIAKALSDSFGTVEIRRVEFVDSQVSKQLRTDGALAVLYALLAILVYIAIRFDVLFGPGAIIGLVQDTFAAMMVFVFGRYEFDLPSVAALLTIVGVSINNTIIVYDRIRETIPPGGRNTLTDEEATAKVNHAVNATLGRNINTALTVLFTTVSLWLLAGGIIKSFALTLTVGIALGVFSSTFVAPATYLWMRRHFGHKDASPVYSNKKKGEYTREDRAKGVV